MPLFSFIKGKADVVISNVPIFSFDHVVVISNVLLFSFIKREADVVISNMHIFSLNTDVVIYMCLFSHL